MTEDKVVLISAREITELKAEYIQTEKEYADLKIKYAELKEQLRIAGERIDVLSNKNIELSNLFEKMKRPQNCKHSGTDYCMSNGYCVCDKWELKE